MTTDPSVTAKILAHLGLAAALPATAPARAPPWVEDELELNLADDADIELESAGYGDPSAGHGIDDDQGLGRRPVCLS